MSHSLPSMVGNRALLIVNPPVPSAPVNWAITGEPPLVHELNSAPNAPGQSLPDDWVTTVWTVAPASPLSANIAAPTASSPAALLTIPMILFLAFLIVGRAETR